MAIELPLFPLNVVLFPGTELPLHIFEARHRQLINECHEQRSPFGVVLARPSSEHLHEVPCLVGTMAEIESLERLEDGRINLVARGSRRFRILSQHHLKPYLSGIVEIYSDVHETGEQLNRVVQQARLLFRAYLETLLAVIGQDELDFSLPDGAEELSHFIAHLMDIHDEQKQRMLELTSTSQRLEEEVVILRREVPFMREVLSMNQRFQADMPDHSMLN